MGLNQENGEKFILSLILVTGVFLIRWLLGAIIGFSIRGGVEARRGRFWYQQGISLLCAVLIITGLASVWFNNPERLTTAAGLFTAGLAFALQKGYHVDCRLFCNSARQNLYRR